MIKEKYPYPLTDDNLPYDNGPMSGSVVSSTECTGLTRIIPEDEEEAEAYEEIYNIPLSPEKKYH